MSEGLSKEQAKEIALRGLKNPHYFATTFFQEWFPLPMPWFHRAILAILTKRCDFLLEFDEHYGQKDLDKILKHFVWKEDPNDPQSQERPIFELTEDGGIFMTLGKNTLVLVPRGGSKTTLCNVANIYNTVYQDTEFVVYISETQTHASTQLKNVGTELSGNRLLRAVFGDLRPDQRSGLRWSESEGWIETTNGVVLVARGRGSQIRGMNVRAKRPDRMIWDDLEDKESVATEEQRLKTRTWAFGDAMPALPRLNKNATIVCLATLLHQDALVTYLERDPDWTTVKLAVIDRDGDPLWPEWMDHEAIEREKQSYAMKGLLNVFYMEYFNTIRNEDSAKFRQDMLLIEYVRPEEVPYRAMVIDPAISGKPGRDWCVIAVAGMRKNGLIQVLDGWEKQGATPREQIDKYFELHFRWLPQQHGVESIAYQAALVHLLKEEMFRKAKDHGPSAYFEVTPITHSSDTNKNARVEGILQPRFASHFMRFQRPFPVLATQLLDWPNGKKDWPDALAMTVRLLDAYAGIAGGEAMAPGKDEYLPLEELFGGEWRTY